MWWWPFADRWCKSKINEIMLLLVVFCILIKTNMLKALENSNTQMLPIHERWRLKNAKNRISECPAQIQKPTEIGWIVMCAHVWIHTTKHMQRQQQRCDNSVQVSARWKKKKKKIKYTPALGSSYVCMEWDD